MAEPKIEVRPAAKKESEKRATQDDRAARFVLPEDGYDIEPPPKGDDTEERYRDL